LSPQSPWPVCGQTLTSAGQAQARKRFVEGSRAPPPGGRSARSAGGSASAGEAVASSFADSDVLPPGDTAMTSRPHRAEGFRPSRTMAVGAFGAGCFTCHRGTGWPSSFSRQQKASFAG
jgi:hypothetical protein